MWDEVKSPGSKRKTNSLIRRHAIKGNGAKGKTFQRGKNPKGVVTLLGPTHRLLGVLLNDFLFQNII
jgi:hypothetical protein